MKTVSICEVISDTFDKMDLKLHFGYGGCHEEFQMILNGTIKFYFFLKMTDTDFSDDCLSTSATNFNHLIQKGIEFIWHEILESHQNQRSCNKTQCSVLQTEFRVSRSQKEGNTKVCQGKTNFY
ncbi:hypothetical protein D915_010944 [Fasciola hepatica]|uniref:Uncharacterized protein n=1 Tax=Fasciola hepatica TaxID=6192 RepID=A0A4E0QV01_FASHE|nr:hypothetical protein D915_010944 [Fasciola hepatica]